MAQRPSDHTCESEAASDGVLDRAVDALFTDGVISGRLVVDSEQDTAVTGVG